MSTHLHGPADVLRAAMVSAGLGVRMSTAPAPNVAVWPIFVGHIADVPDNAVCIYDTSGKRDGRIMATGENIDKPGWQVRVRATTNPLAWAKAKAIMRYFATVRNLGVAIDGDLYTIIAITRTGTPLVLGQEVDAKRRDTITFNGTVTLKEVHV